jgi:hypothetical protein
VEEYERQLRVEYGVDESIEEVETKLQQNFLEWLEGIHEGLTKVLMPKVRNMTTTAPASSKNC